MLYCLQNVVKARSREYNFCLCIRQLHLNAGEYVAITGPSGCGKSTSLDILGMTLKPDNAEALLFSPCARGYDLKALWLENNFDAMAMLRRQHVGYVLQTGDLLAFFNVVENIMLTARLAGIAENDAREHVGMLMEHLQISPLAKAMPATLSVGERQRVAICRALASKPSLILADEPTAALDPVLSRSVMRLFLAIVQETNATVVMVSHDIALVKEFNFREVPVLISHESDSVLAVLDDSGSK